MEIIYFLIRGNLILLINYINKDTQILIEEKIENFCFNCIDNEL